MATVHSCCNTLLCVYSQYCQVDLNQLYMLKVKLFLENKSYVNRQLTCGGFAHVRYSLRYRPRPSTTEPEPGPLGYGIVPLLGMIGHVTWS